MSHVWFMDSERDNLKKFKKHLDLNYCVVKHPLFTWSFENDTAYFKNDASPLSDLAEKSYHCCGSFNSPRCVRARDTDSRPNCIRSYYDLSNTPKAALRTESMGLPEAHHGAACRALNVDRKPPRVLFISESHAYFTKLTL